MLATESSGGVLEFRCKVRASRAKAAYGGPSATLSPLSQFASPCEGSRVRERRVMLSIQAANPSVKGTCLRQATYVER